MLVFVQQDATGCNRIAKNARLIKKYGVYSLVTVETSVSKLEALILKVSYYVKDFDATGIRDLVRRMRVLRTSAVQELLRQSSVIHNK